MPLLVSGVRAGLGRESHIGTGHERGPAYNAHVMARVNPTSKETKRGRVRDQGMAGVVCLTRADAMPSGERQPLTGVDLAATVCVGRPLTPRRCHAIVFAAITNGVLRRPRRCQVCGRYMRARAHHDDYSRPLAVRWLCQRCHMALYRKFSLHTPAAGSPDCAGTGAVPGLPQPGPRPHLMRRRSTKP